MLTSERRVAVCMHTAAIKPIEREVKVTVENFSKPPRCEVTVLFSLKLAIQPSGPFNT